MPTRLTDFSTGDVLEASDLNALGGIWNAWVPQIDQGATTNIAKTTGYAKHLRFSHLVMGRFHLTVTAAGTAGAPVTVTLPAARAGGTDQVIGSGYIYDASVDDAYPCVLVFNAQTDEVCFLRTDAPTGSTGDRWGEDPNVALASGDVLSGSFIYEAS
jgi:hypothetical protein